MRGVDIADALRASYTVRQKTVRWQTSLFYWAVDVALVNAYILGAGLIGSPQCPSKHLDFRVAVVRGLLDAGLKFSVPRRASAAVGTAAILAPPVTFGSHARPPVTSGASRLRAGGELPDVRFEGRSWDHKLAKGKQGRCQLCYSRWLQDCRSDKPGRFHGGFPKYTCTFCGVHLCIPECFNAYHDPSASTEGSEMQTDA
jgi:hypothetical protein